MVFNFELILFYATMIAGIIVLLDKVFLAPKRLQKQMKRIQEIKLPILVDYARSFFPVLLAVFLIRSFLFEPFRIPSGSLEPTLTLGDFILVNKFDYGVRLPVIHKKIFNIGEPKRGDIVVFRWPADKRYDFIKRVVGIPGDHISYINKELYVNGKKIPQVMLKNSVDDENGLPVIEKEEDLLGVKHHIYQSESKDSRDYRDIIVPEGMYFMMGDNRDDSADSRYWGVVSEKEIIGKAVLIWMSWDKVKSSMRWQRIGKRIK